jgi:hypothetical protein
LDVGGVGQPGPRRESACELGLSPCPEGATKFSNIAYYDLSPLQGGFDKKLTQALAHARQPKVLVLEFESFDGILSPKDQGIFIFDKPFKVLALFQLNRVG